MPAVLGYGAALAAILATFDYTGGSLYGASPVYGVDEVSRKEYIRTNRRRPVEETVHQLGEGRGKFILFPALMHEVGRKNNSKLEVLGVYWRAWRDLRELACADCVTLLL